MDTGIIVLIVHMDLHNWSMLKPVNDSPMKGVIRLGDGAYNDFDIDWFVTVGAGLAFTIFMQIASTALPPVVMEFYHVKWKSP